MHPFFSWWSWPKSANRPIDIYKNSPNSEDQAESWFLNSVENFHLFISISSHVRATKTTFCALNDLLRGVVDARHHACAYVSVCWLAPLARSGFWFSHALYTVLGIHISFSIWLHVECTCSGAQKLRNETADYLYVHRTSTTAKTVCSFHVHTKMFSILMIFILFSLRAMYIVASTWIPCCCVSSIKQNEPST